MPYNSAERTSAAAANTSAAASKQATTANDAGGTLAQNGVDDDSSNTARLEAQLARGIDNLLNNNERAGDESFDAHDEVRALSC